MFVFQILLPYRVFYKILSHKTLHVNVTTTVATNFSLFNEVFAVTVHQYCFEVEINVGSVTTPADLLVINKTTFHFAMNRVFTQLNSC